MTYVPREKYHDGSYGDLSDVSSEPMFGFTCGVTESLAAYLEKILTSSDGSNDFFRGVSYGPTHLFSKLPRQNILLFTDELKSSSNNSLALLEWSKPEAVVGLSG